MACVIVRSLLYNVAKQAFALFGEGRQIGLVKRLSAAAKAAALGTQSQRGHIR